MQLPLFQILKSNPGCRRDACKTVLFIDRNASAAQLRGPDGDV
jgi:hypothetical protein